MSRLGSTSPSGPKGEPSWTPPVQDLDDIRARRRSRHRQDDNLSPDWGVNLQNLVKSRRPSFNPSLPEYFRQARKPRREAAEETLAPEIVQPVETLGLPESPEEGKNLRSSLEINVKDLVGDAVGNMSISPVSRDIVLAARRGLFIIDLESPFSIPRFLPQGGTWDVADVQWNPHHSHAQYIVSTSSERLLIWNLMMSGKTSIEHILLSHYRAITDINWHTTECDIVASTGIDSWLWAWDLREPRKPIFGLSAFKAGGTQVKWNRKDGNILASSHSNEVLIWDRRKGSLPITQIRAHSSKIYGIDWSRSSRNEIVTCSLDKSIKTWDINASDLQENPEPKATILTNYPVWRARNLPFGEGILSLPQRGETTLEMYVKGEQQELIETFEGHSDVVKEFVWREGAQDAFQLITWSKDRTLRFWPIDFEVMQKAGYVPQIVRGRSKLTRIAMESKETFRHPPETNGAKNEHPALSAPIGNRGILAEVRATHPAQAVLYPKPTFSTVSSLGSDDPFAKEPAPVIPTNKSISSSIAGNGRSTGGTMSKGGAGTQSAAQVDPLAWLASVRVGGGKRGSSSGGGSRGDGGSGGPSRLGSGSRPPSAPGRSLSEIGSRQESESASRDGVDRKEADGSQSLQDEITSVLTKLVASKIKLEKHDPKKRSCTLGLHGPWGETSHVFLRLTFTFPRDYPQAIAPHGIPTVELERNPLIPVRTRAYILKHLRRIRESKRPCLEACLRFLLFAYENQNDNDLMDSDSDSDDEEQPNGKKSKEATASLLRSHKNLAEPVSSQGAFGPNGEFVTFFRAPPRIVNNVLRNLTRGAGPRRPTREKPPAIPEPPPSPPPPPPQPQTPQQPKKSYLQSPALVSDAVRRLGLAATDRYVQAIDPRRPEAGADIIRAMTNLFTVPQHNRRRDSMSQQHTDGEGSKNYALLAPKRSNVFFTATADIGGADRKVALGYVFMADTLAEVCDKNSEVARDLGRYDHERVFRTLRTLFIEPEDAKKKGRRSSFTSDALAAQVITRLYADIAVEKDVQMLAMIAVLVLQTEHVSVLLPSLSRKKESTPIVPSISHRAGGTDYFSLMKSTTVPSPISPGWPRQLSPTIPALVSSFSSSNSSRGSWSSLFNTGSMQRFMNGVQDTFKEGLGTPGEMFPSPVRETPGALSRSAERVPRNQHSPVPVPLRRRVRKDSALYSPVNVSKSWNEGLTHPSKTLSPSFSIGHRKPPLRVARSNVFIHEKRMVISEPPLEFTPPVFTPQLIEQFKLNVYYYAELLFRWQFYDKRLELLKAVNRRDGMLVPIRTEVNRIGLHRICPRADCKMLFSQKVHVCPHCNTPCSMPPCTVCRLPVKGLSRTCLSCSHVTHISCWNSLEWSVPICPSGCGCFCTGTPESPTRPPTRLGLSPPPTTLLFASELP